MGVFGGVDRGMAGMNTSDTGGDRWAYSRPAILRNCAPASFSCAPASFSYAPAVCAPASLCRCSSCTSPFRRRRPRAAVRAHCLPARAAPSLSRSESACQHPAPSRYSQQPPSRPPKAAAHAPPAQHYHPARLSQQPPPAPRHQPSRRRPRPQADSGGPRAHASRSRQRRGGSPAQPRSGGGGGGGGGTAVGDEDQD